MKEIYNKLEDHIPIVCILPLLGNEYAVFVDGVIFHKSDSISSCHKYINTQYAENTGFLLK